MGLSWINPLFLSGLLLLAIPVLIHLVRRQDASGTRFPSLMFLERIPRQEKSRLVIRDWPLLLLRCLLLLLAVLAFARPFLDSGAAVGTDPVRSDSVVLIDRSYSMRMGERWQQARASGLRLLGEKNALDRIGLMLFDDEAEMLSDLSVDAGNLRSLLQGASPGFRATRLTTAVEQAAGMLAGSNAARKRIFVISDFRAAAVPAAARVPADIEITALPVESTGGANVSLTSVTIEPSSRDADREFAISVEVTNRADTALQQTLTLTLDGRELGRRELRLAPRAQLRERFDRLAASSDLLRGVVSLGDDALALDNRSYFVYSSRQQQPVLILEGPGARANQSLYLQSALRLARNPVFRIERKTPDELEAVDLTAWAAIILNDAAIPAGEPGRALADYVAAGGALLVTTGDAAPRNWPAGADAYLPGSPGRRVDANRGTAFSITDFDPDHPLTAALGARAVIDLSLARVFSYRALQPGPQDRVLARYGDGAAALLERRVGAGRVMALTTTLDTHWNDLALQPAFLPFLHQALRYLTAFEPYPHQAEIGAVIDVMRYARALAGADAMLAAAGGAGLIVETPSTRALPVSRQSPLLTLAEPGFYQVHRATPAGVEVTLAANVDPREASHQPLDVGRFVEEIRASAEPARARAAPTRRQAAGYEQQQQLWFALLSVALLLVLLEALAANRAGGARSVRKRVKAA